MSALLPGVEFRLEVSLGLSDEARVDLYDDPAALYDEAVYSGQELYWIDFGSRFISAQTSRGRDKYGDRYPPGTMSFVVADDDGIFNPDAGAVQIGGQQFRVGRFARLIGRENPAAEWVPIWMGRIETLTESFTPGGGSIRMTATCVDLQQWLARTDPPALPTPIPTGQGTGARVTDVLSRAGYPDEWNRPGDIDVGVHTMRESSYGQNYLELCNQAAEAEGGAFFVGPEGFFRFRDQNWLSTDTVKHVVGAQGQPIQVIGLQSLKWDAGRVRNDVQISRVGGTAQRVISSASQSFYQPRTYRRLDLQMETDAQAFTIAEKMVEFWQWDVARLSEFEVVPTTPAAARQIMELDLGDYLIVQIRTLRGWDYTIGAWVERVNHTVTADDWSCKLVVENADRSRPGTGGPYSDAYSDAYSPERGFPNPPLYLYDGSGTVAQNGDNWGVGFQFTTGGDGTMTPDDILGTRFAYCGSFGDNFGNVRFGPSGQDRCPGVGTDPIELDFPDEPTLGPISFAWNETNMRYQGNATGWKATWQALAGQTVRVQILN